MAKHVITIDKALCIGCGMCRQDCPTHCIDIKNGKAGILANDCILCGHCLAICPKEAVSISGYEAKPIAKKQEIRLNPGEVLDVIRFRRTIRQFSEQQISNEIMEQILEAGRLTHTAKNMQDVSFIVLDKEKNRLEQMAVHFLKKLKPFLDLFSPLAKRTTIDDHFFFFHAPKVIVVIAKNPINGVLAAQNMEFVAEANGLGVLFSGYFTIAANRSRKIKKALAIPPGKKAVATLVLGYPRVKYQRSVQREKLDVKYM